MILLLIVGGMPFVAMHRYAPIFNLPAFSIVNVDPLKWLTEGIFHYSPEHSRPVGGVAWG